MDIALPGSPEPVQVEIELTNACNARCTGCPRSDMAPKGLMKPEVMQAVMEVYQELSADLAINRATGETSYPSVTFAGGGDPFLHPRAMDFIEQAVAFGRPTHVITNASKLDEAKVDRLVRSGLSSIAVSFWGIREDEYEAAMGLRYHRVLPRVEHLADQAAQAGIPLCIVWVRSAEITSSEDEIREFWGERSIDVDFTDNYMWNRGGLLPVPAEHLARQNGSFPDPDREIWCTDMYFSDSVRWNGDVVLCCCNYFTSKPIVLGNIVDDGFEVIKRRKQEIHQARPLPKMCQECVLPRRQRAEWLAEPWLPVVSGNTSKVLLGEGIPFR